MMNCYGEGDAALFERFVTSFLSLRYAISRVYGENEGHACQAAGQGSLN